MTARVVLADDHKIVREGLRSILENDFGMEVVGQAEDGRTAVALARDLKPDIVIIDITMPDLNGIEATRQILAANDRIKIIGLSMHADRRYIAEMFGAGASAYLLKHCAMDELQLAIQAVLDNKTYVSPEIAGVVVQDYLSHREPSGTGKEQQLTAKEREILQLVAEGKATKEIALQLHISIPTVETHRRHIMEKLGLYTVAELTKYAIRHGFTSLE